jgi:phage shock protein C
MKDPTRFFSRLGLYRNVKEGWITGVCAGIADRLSVKPFWVRIAIALITAIGHFIGPAIVYLLLAFLMKPRDEAGGATPAAAAGRRVTELKTRFARLDARLNHLEAAVTSDELSLRRKFRDIGG